MNRQEAIRVLEMINELYPRSTISKDKAKMLITALLPMDFAGVNANLAVYVATHPYAPTIAEIAAYPVAENEMLNQLELWREEAEHVPMEIKQKFQAEMTRLIGGLRE